MNFPRFPMIVPALDGHMAEIAGDFRRLSATSVVDGVALSASMRPTGNPPLTKSRRLAIAFRQLREALGHDAPPSGILLQSTMGHGRADRDLPPFQRIVRSYGDEPAVFCPLDKDFVDFIAGEVAKLAAERPAFFILDDDTRLRTHRDACFCPLHLAEFSRRTGRDWRDRESLIAALAADPSLAAAWEKLRLDTIARLARAVRGAFNAADPSIPGAFCCCEADVGDALAIARLLAAAGQRPVIRINNGRYFHDGNRDLPTHLLRTEGQLLALPPDSGAILLDEPDTCPHNRYSVSAANLHLHISLGLLSGLDGAKLWLTRMDSWEPASGEAYRRILKRNAGFYRELIRLAGGPPGASGAKSTGISWEGLRIPLSVPEAGAGPATPREGRDWGSSILGRMGIPYAYVRPEDARGHAAEKLSAAFAEPLPEPGCCSIHELTIWFNETRKREIAAVLERLAMDEGDLPCWFTGDDEVMLRAGRAAGGDRILLVVPLSHDALENIPLRFPFTPAAAMERLLPDGSWRPASFDSSSKVLRETVMPADPAVFRHIP